MNLEQSSDVVIVGIGKHTKKRKLKLGKELSLGKNRCLIDSQQHASLKYLSGQGWVISDNNTTDGVYVNQQRLKPETNHRLKNNDKFSLGPNTKGYEWRIQRLLVRTPSIEDPELETVKKSRVLDDDIKNTANVTTSSANTSVASTSSAKKVKTRFLERFTQEKDNLDPRLIEEPTAEQKMEIERKEFEKKYSEMALKNAENESSMATLQKEKDKMEEKLKMFEQLNENMRENLQKEKAAMEEKFNCEKELLQREFKAKHEEFEATKKAENEEFEKRLIETKLISDQQRIEEKNAKKLKMDFLNSCKDELKCSICIELFITPVTLNCGHIFCQFCINQFELEVKTNKDFNCPNCKIPITSQTRCRQIENLITAIYSDVDESLFKEREALIEERKKTIWKEPQKLDCEKVEKTSLHSGWSIHSFLRNLE